MLWYAFAIEGVIMMERESSEDLFTRVGEAFGELGSVKKAADYCHISEVKCRRILITLGMWSSPASRQVAALKNAGLSTVQIADHLHLTAKAVEAYLPYQYGAYGVDVQSVRAACGESYRQRQKNAAANMQVLRRKGEDDMGKIIDFDSIAQPDCETRRRKWRESQKAKFSVEDYKKLRINADEKVSAISDESSFSFDKGIVYRLHLELDDTTSSDFNDSKDRKDFCRFAKAENSISRDILVPGNMNLHALHYVIQRAFGWQNSHLHDFSLTQEDFDRVTAGRLSTYLDLCGVVFAFPNDDNSDRCWDDDYKEGVSIKTWLKHKYGGPYRDYSVGDSWFGNRVAVGAFRKACPAIKDDDFLVDIEDQFRFEQSLNRLTERLTMKELFAPPKQGEQYDLRRWKEDVESKTRILWKKVSSSVMKQYTNGITELAKWRESYSALDHELWIHPEETKKEVRRVMKKTVEEFMANHSAAIEGWTEELHDVFETLVARPTPFIGELHYAYDYGDDWHVTITVQEVYDAKVGDVYDEVWTMPYISTNADMKKKCQFYASDGSAVDIDSTSKMATIYIDEKPCCIVADGLNVVDDCGGVSGFLEMLCTIYGKDKEEGQSMREWANGLGWTGRKSRTENML